MTKAELYRNKRVAIRLSELERDLLEAVAAKNQMDLSDCIRWLIRKEADKL